MSISDLREELRTYLTDHELPQERLARELDVSYSWLNKFCLGKFENVRFERLDHLVQWMAADKQKRSHRVA